MSTAVAYFPDGRREAKISSLDWFMLSVPFEDRVRWQMLKAGLKAGKALPVICDDAGLSPRRMSAYFWRGSDLDLRSVITWAFACGFVPDPIAFLKRPAPSHHATERATG